MIDAKDAVVGRLATFIAMRLRGKHRADYTPNVDCGDYVVVVNADKVKFTGRKLDQKTYYWHTGYPGGIKERTAGKILDGRFPERMLEKAVERMLPKESPLARKQIHPSASLQRAEHPHEAQKPEVIDFVSITPRTPGPPDHDKTPTASRLFRAFPPTRPAFGQPQRPAGYSPSTDALPRDGNSDHFESVFLRFKLHRF